LALEAGAWSGEILATIAEAALDVPVALMTYVNPVYRHGFEAFLTEAERSGVAGIIVPDLPVDESVEWTAACAGRGIASVQLAARASDDRLA
jgi:tryptophan synthase alpha chain